MGKNSRFQEEYRSNASQYHIKVGEALKASPIFKGYEIYQEYPVDKVNADHFSARHHFDWAIPKLKVVFEVHGQQHYEAVCFGGIEEEEAENNLWDTLYRDKVKEEAAKLAGWTYVVIPYTEEINSDTIYKMYKAALEIDVPILPSAKKQKEKERRHEQYNRNKNRRLGKSAK